MISVLLHFVLLWAVQAADPCPLPKVCAISVNTVLYQTAFRGIQAPASSIRRCHYFVFFVVFFKICLLSPMLQCAIAAVRCICYIDP